jgi:hypothetical protein
MDFQTFIKIINEQPMLNGLYKIQKEEFRKQKNAKIRAKKLAEKNCKT